MCFSATASFTTAAALVIAGAVSMSFATNCNRQFIPINLLSFFFALQQFAEGMIWIDSPWLSANIWGGIFLFFAFFVYPWYFGYSSYLLTRDKKRKKIILLMTLFGALFGAGLYSAAVFVTGFYADATCCAHVHYYFPLLQQTRLNYLSLVYVLLVSIPLFFCDRKGTTTLAWLILVTATSCWLVYVKFFISVWCFFAAVITGGISVITCAQWYRIVKKFDKR